MSETPYHLMSGKKKITHNRALIDRLIFDLGGPMTAANKLGYTDAWLRRRVNTPVVKDSENLLSMLKGLEKEPKFG